MPAKDAPQVNAVVRDVLDDLSTELGDPPRGNGGLKPGKIEEAVRQILVEIGEDPEREGLAKTPARVHRMYRELTAGYFADPSAIINDALFEHHSDSMILVRDVEFYSLCEHHLLPFYGVAHIGYIPNGRIVGLSKIPRIIEMFARRLQIQERLTEQIAQCLMDSVQARGVAVVMEGTHLCTIMRGVRKSGTRMVTSTMLGSFKDDPGIRAEFLDHLRKPLVDF